MESSVKPENENTIEDEHPDESKVVNDEMEWIAIWQTNPQPITKLDTEPDQSDDYFLKRLGL